MSSIAVRRTPTPRQCSRKNLPIRRTSKDQKPTKALTHQKGHLSDHGKGAANIIHVAEKTVADVKTSNRTGEQLQQHSDVGLSSPKKKTRRHSPVPLSPTQHRISDCSQDVNDADNSDQDSSITVWHGHHCPNCVALNSINEVNFARLQHRFKYCATYCVYYHLMTDIEKQVVSNENMKDKYEKLSHIYRSEQAQRLCVLLVENVQEFPSIIKSESSKRAIQLFKKAAKLSGELLGPAETTAFDCKRYEEYMRLLLEIAQMIQADAELIGDIKMYLKPFERSNRIGTRSKPHVKWGETFWDLKHSPQDEHFGSNLKEIAELESGQESFLKSTGYTKNCH